MAKTFTRFPIIGGDLNSWASYNDAQNELSLGLISSKLYDNSGSLYVSTGKIGLSDGTYKGVVDIDTAESISLAGVSTSNWALIEIYITGISVVIVASDISGAIDENEVPSNFTSTYNAVKGGYYRVSTRRTLGIAYKDGAGSLGKVISCLSFDNFSGEDIRGQNGYINKINMAQFRITSSNVTVSSATYVDIPLDTEDYNFIKDCSLNTSGNMELPEGLYKINVNVETALTGGGVSIFYMEIHNKTDGAALSYLYPNVFNSASTLTISGSNISFLFNLTSAKEVSFRAKISGSNVDIVRSFADHGGLNILIEKLDGE